MNRLTILQHNVNSWYIKRHELYNTYRTIDADIILLNDTSILQDQHLKLHHYTVYTSNSNNTTHSGTAIAIKNTISHTVLDDFETDLLAINVNTPQGTITIGTDYIPPRINYFYFPDYLQLLHRRNPVYIFADLNARHHSLGHSNNNTVGEALFTLIRHDEIEHIGPTFPTFIRTNASTTPDIVITNKETFHNILLTPGPVTTSDHIPVIATITANPIQIPILPRPHFSRADWDSYKSHLQNHPIPNLNNATTQQIDSAIKDWTDHITQASDEHIPKLTYRIIPGVSPNDDIRQTHTDLTNLYNSIRLHGVLPTYAQQIIRLRRKLREQYKSARAQTWNEIVQNIDITDDPTNFWKSIKRFRGNKKQQAPYLRDEHNNKLKLPQEKEALFTRYTTKLYTENTPDEDEDLEFDIENIDTVNHHMSQNIQLTQPFSNADTNRLDIVFPPITFTELKKQISSLKQRSPGPSKITATHLKHLPEHMIHILTDIFNKTISLGYYPNQFKKSLTIFIPKPNQSQYLVSNYRPISLLDIEGKLLDKNLNKKLIAQMQFGQHFNPRQHGFTPHRGTHTALATIYEPIANAKTQGSFVNLVLRDISKAFDKVWHAGLQYKILSLQFPTCLTKLLCSYLTDRQTSVRIGTHIGPPIHLQRGVPQGGCLSPTLYNLFTSDTPEPAPFSEHVMYADDLTQIITYPSRSRHLLALYTARAIDNITNFERKWKIQTNMNKFQLVNFLHINTEPVMVDDESTNIPYNQKGTVLGLHITRHGLKNHVTHRIRCATYHVAQLAKFRNLSTRNKLKIMKSTVLPSLIYPTVPLNTLSDHQFRRLQVIYNKAIRIITNTSLLDGISTRSLHSRLKIKPINSIVHEQAKNTWQNLKDMHENIYNSLLYPHPRRYRTHLPSSRIIAESTTPGPLYTTGDTGSRARLPRLRQHTTPT